MRLKVSFSPEEYDMVMQALAAVKRIFVTARMRPPKPGRDGQYHASLSTFP